MQINVTGRHVQLTEDIKAYTEEKAGKLHRYYDRIHEIEVIFNHESEQFTAEMIVRADAGHPFVASDSGPDTFMLVDTVVEKLEKQLKRHKERLRNHKHDGKPEVPAADDEL